MTINQLIKYLSQIKDLHGGNLKTNINISEMVTTDVTYNIRGKSLHIKSITKGVNHKEVE